MGSEEKRHSLFFYGTLMVPAVLERVIGRQDATFVTRDAVLPGHTRHHVRNADYPAVVTAKVGASVLGRDNLTPDESCVRGSLVTGLTADDVAFLDEFEGDEYTREPVCVSLVSSESSSSLLSLSSPDSDPGSVETEVYLWCAPASRLAPSLWSFDDFMRDKAHRWVGSGADSNVEYLEVDKRRAMRGAITPPVNVDVDGDAGQRALPRFGKPLRDKYWNFEKGWVNVNHGSYGSAPLPVMEAFQKLQMRNSVAPDRFLRLEYMSELIALRRRIADLVHCESDDIVAVTNATTGVNVVLTSMAQTYEPNDKFLNISSTIYNACSASLRHVVDVHPHLNLALVDVPIHYPIKHQDLVAAVEKVISEEIAKGCRIRLALIDAISSNPGVVVPWKDLVKVFRKYGILSLVDAAHELGQLPVNLQESQPDFWVSNAHKWLLSPRTCAFLYVSKPYQHLMHSIVTGHSYTKRDSTSPPGSWVTEFEWYGTIDWSPVLAVNAALDFRDMCGGERRINAYCHDLAVRAGEYVARVLQTEVLGDEELVANMNNVRLPIDYGKDDEERGKIRNFLVRTQIEEHKTIAAPFTHKNHWWVRLSAQIYNDDDDFVYLANVLQSICERLRKGEHISPEKES